MTPVFLYHNGADSYYAARGFRGSLRFKKYTNCITKIFHNMNLTAQIAKHFRDVHFGGNWTSVNLKETLTDVTWQQATTKIYSLNTIATLVFISIII
jgi:hypothetical protein